MPPTDPVDNLVDSTRATYVSTLLVAAEAARNHKDALAIALRLTANRATFDLLTAQIAAVSAEENRLRLWAATTPRESAR